MSGVFLRVLNIGITAGWIVLAVILLRLVLQRAPKRLCVAAWGLVALRLMIPVSIESGISLVPSAETVSFAPVQAETATQGERIVFETGFPAVDRTINPTDEQSARRVDTVAVLKQTAVALWLAGAVGMLLYAFLRSLLLKRSVRASIRIEKGVYLCDEIRDPFVLGILRPKIYLPSGTDETTRSLVLLHERAHIRRFDHLIKPFGFLLLSVYWFHPLLWLAYILFCRDVELACDEKVVRSMDGEGKAAYAAALLTNSVSRRSAVAGSLAFGAGPVKRRVRAVLHSRKPSRLSCAAGVLACALTAVFFLTVPKAPLTPAYPDLTSEEQLYGRWTLDCMQYREYEDGALRTLKREQLDSRLHMTFLPDGVVRFLSEPGCRETEGVYQVDGNTVRILGKEHADTGNTLHAISISYDPQTDSLIVSIRSLATEYFTRTEDPAPSDPLSATASASAGQITSANTHR